MAIKCASNGSARLKFDLPTPVKFGKFELNLALTGFVKFAIAPLANLFL
ncbi:MAG: hypothetical protein ACTTJF_09880 [Campylobacter sp.]